MKTPTCVLTELKDDRYTFLDFGYDAEERYVTLLANRRKDSVCLFNRFKMKLYTEVSNLLIEGGGYNVYVLKVVV